MPYTNMKPYKIIISALVSSALLFSSCSKDFL